MLNADFALSFNSTLEEALQRGMPLYFLLEVDILRPRWYWFDEKVLRHSTQYRVSFQPLTRQYRVASGLLSQTFDSLEEVERLIGRVTRGRSRTPPTSRRARDTTSSFACVSTRTSCRSRSRSTRSLRANGSCSESPRIPLHAVSSLLSSRSMRWVLLASASLVGDRAVPARHGEREHRAVRAAATTTCWC